MESSKLKCIGNNDTFLICCFKQCKNNPFMCKDDHCQCQQIHKKCGKNIKWKLFQEKIKIKLDITNESLKNYLQEIKGIYKNIIKQIQKSQNLISTNFIFGMGQADYELLKQLKQNKVDRVNGSLINNFCQIFEREEKRQISDLQIKKNQITKQTNILINMLNQLTSTKNRNNDDHNKSKIIQNFLSIEDYFEIKKIKNFKLLYRASQNQFLISKFWQKCNKKINTITLVKTQFNKIIGGYTPLPWIKDLNSYQQDSSYNTFLFSLTQNRKLGLIHGKQSKAIFSNNKFGPHFGGGVDFRISDKANQNANSYTRIGFTFNNGQYIYGDQSSILKFSGQAKGNSFLIQQWQVYEIEFH